MSRLSPTQFALAGLCLATACGGARRIPIERATIVPDQRVELQFTPARSLITSSRTRGVDTILVSALRGRVVRTAPDSAVIRIVSVRAPDASEFSNSYPGTTAFIALDHTVSPLELKQGATTVVLFAALMAAGVLAYLFFGGIGSS